MTSEPVVGVVFGRPVEGKTTLSYICLPFHSPTQASQLTGTSSYYQFQCHYPLITYLSGSKGLIFSKVGLYVNGTEFASRVHLHM